MDCELYNVYLDILREELVPAMGCTEPIAIALASAIARKTLGLLPDSIELVVSGNIIKNVKSVIVPHTNGRKGLKVALAAGVLYGNSDAHLEVLSKAKEKEIEMLDGYIKDTEINITEASSPYPFDIDLTVKKDNDCARVRVVNKHTNIVHISRNGEVLFEKAISQETVEIPKNRELLSVDGIVEFADNVRIEDVKEILDRQISYNMAIAQSGLKNGYGACIGQVLLKAYGNDVNNKAKAYAAAASDARMGGCELPVVINSGSGNQGITASVPVIVYARELKKSEEELYRSLVVSDLVTIHLKTGIGSLSAYCGATSAGTGAGAGICYLLGGRFSEIAHTIVNALAIDSGMICDGAKASCAAKIASAVEAGLLGMQMNRQGKEFFGGDGIIVKGVENTIKAVSTIAREGMRETDNRIIDLMINQDK